MHRSLNHGNGTNAEIHIFASVWTKWMFVVLWMYIIQRDTHFRSFYMDLFVLCWPGDMFICLNHMTLAITASVRGKQAYPVGKDTRNLSFMEERLLSVAELPCKRASFFARQRVIVLVSLVDAENCRD